MLGRFLYMPDTFQQYNHISLFHIVIAIKDNLSECHISSYL